MNGLGLSSLRRGQSGPWTAPGVTRPFPGDSMVSVSVPIDSFCLPDDGLPPESAASRTPQCLNIPLCSRLFSPSLSSCLSPPLRHPRRLPPPQSVRKKRPFRFPRFRSSIISLTSRHRSECPQPRDNGRRLRRPGTVERKKSGRTASRRRPGGSCRIASGPARKGGQNTRTGMGEDFHPGRRRASWA